jgi:hypothetical protein
MPPVYATSNLYRSEESRRLGLQEQFVIEHSAYPLRWSAHNLSRLLNLTGERPARVAEMRAILGALGMGPEGRWPAPGGVFDHGEFWARSGKPWAIVGHPYGVAPAERELLSTLARFTPRLRVNVNDRPSYYGFGSDHVRIELTEPRRPWTTFPATPKTRSAASTFRRALMNEVLEIEED